MNTANVNGIKLEFESQGRGEAVVLIHGSIVSDAYLPMMPERALAEYQLIRYRRRGFDGSSHTPPPVRIQDQARDCLGLIRHLGLARAHVVGHSYGGVTATQLFFEDASVVHTLSLLEPALIWMVPQGPEMQAGLASAMQLYHAGDKAGAIDNFMAGVGGADYRAKMDFALPGAYQRAVADADTFFQIELPALMEYAQTMSAENLRMIKIPVLAMVGRHTAPIFTQIHDKVLATIVQSEPIDIPGAGHMLQMENPTAVAEGLAEFFGNHPMT
ncbi:MAG: alpha/beta hydrolase [Candidatus Binatus sp.]|uniref:alpha/beta fold hydrolase n=1 Tax=Candidatus Binatus sp. TaxID=2811406 RepID=UPI00272716FF|nr:alpha/beta hydrolase [Candidatus Binatus sp.]MDO8434738.1 alpha/beta hydrolase [Candidatus Binatus sp.]